MKRRHPHHKKHGTPFGADHFLLESASALQEYLRFRPHSVLAVGYKKGAEGRMRDLPIHGKTRVLSEDAWVVEHGPAPENTPIWALIVVQPLYEADMQLRLSSRNSDLLLILDHITDPRNLGAIARTAAFFGVKEIVVHKRRQVLLTQATVAAAQGAFALIDLVIVNNLHQTILKLKEAGYWVFGTAMDGDDIRSFSDSTPKRALVLGAEDTGVSRLVRDHCDHMLAIQGSSGNTLDSLNVSVAAGIVLHALCRTNA